MKQGSQSKGALRGALRVRPRPILEDRVVNRIVRFEVALIKCTRLRREFPVEKCAERAGITPKAWRKIEHRRVSPSGKTLVRMMAAVCLTLADILAAMLRKKIACLRVFAGRELLFQ